MTTDAKDWLPRTAAINPAVRLRLREAVADWGTHWFVGEATDVCELQPWSGGGATGAERWTVCGDIGLRTLPAGRERLAAKALGVVGGDAFVTARDREICERLATQMLHDLASRLDKVFGASNAAPHAQDRAPQFESGAAVTAAMALGSGPALTELVVNWPAIVDFAKASFARPRRAGTPPVDLRGALAPTEIELEADLGRARLSLSELATLAPGDVLVLDTKLTEGALVRLTTSSAPLAHARLTNLDGYVGLTFEKTASP